VENDRVERSQALINLIAGLGYRMFWYLPPLFNPDNFYGNAENCYPGILSVNMLCLHKENKLELSGFEEVLDPSFHPLRRQPAADTF
jgi:hypothetical protein